MAKTSNSWFRKLKLLSIFQRKARKTLAQESDGTIPILLIYGHRVNSDGEIQVDVHLTDTYYDLPEEEQTKQVHEIMMEYLEANNLKKKDA